MGAEDPTFREDFGALPSRMCELQHQVRGFRSVAEGAGYPPCQDTSQQVCKCTHGRYLLMQSEYRSHMMMIGDSKTDERGRAQIIFRGVRSGIVSGREYLD